MGAGTGLANTASSGASLSIKDTAKIKDGDHIVADAGGTGLVFRK
jgi:hypothetical protein